MINSLPRDLLSEIANYLTPKSGLAFAWSCRHTFSLLAESRQIWRNKLVPWRDLPTTQLIGRQLAIKILALKPKSIRICYITWYTCDLSNLNKSDLLVKQDQYTSYVLYCDLLTCDHSQCRLRPLVLACDSTKPIDILTFVLTLTPLYINLDIPEPSHLPKKTQRMYKKWLALGYIKQKQIESTDSEWLKLCQIRHLKFLSPPDEYRATFLVNGGTSLVYSVYRLLLTLDANYINKVLSPCKKEILQHIISDVKKYCCTNHYSGCRGCDWWNCASKRYRKEEEKPNREVKYVGFPLSLKAYEYWSRKEYNSGSNGFSEIPID